MCLIEINLSHGILIKRKLSKDYLRKAKRNFVYVIRDLGDLKNFDYNPLIYT